MSMFQIKIQITFHQNPQILATFLNSSKTAVLMKKIANDENLMLSSFYV